MFSRFPIPFFKKKTLFQIHASFRLVGGWTNPSEKYDRQIGFIFPKFSGWKFPKMFELPPPSYVFQVSSTFFQKKKRWFKFHAQLFKTSPSSVSQSARRPILPSTSARPMALQQWNHLRWAISTHIGDGSKIQKQRRNKSPRNTNLDLFWKFWGR